MSGLSPGRHDADIAKDFLFDYGTRIRKAVFYMLTDSGAFEQVSRLKLRPYQRDTLIDIRKIQLPAIRPERDDYDPKDHRAPPHEIKLWMAYFNLLRTMCGAGMLAMPLVISQMGILLGPIITMATGILIIYMHNLLLDCLNEIARQLRIPYISYRYAFRLALLHGPPIFHCIATRGPTIITTFVVASQLGTCCVFVIFTTDSLRDLMDWQSNQPAFLCLLFPYLILEHFMKDLSIVSYIAMLGNLLNLTGIIIVFEHILFDSAGEPVTIDTTVPDILIGFGTVMFNLSVVAVVLSIDKSLTNPRKMRSRFGVLNVGILCPTIISALFGSLGYWAFGTMDENILRSLPFDEISSMIAIGIYLISVAFAYPLQCYPAIMSIIEVIKYRDQLSTPSVQTLQTIESIGRPLFVILTFIIGYLAPFQGPFVAFVGNLCTSMLTLVFPALMDISLRYPSNYGDNYCYLIIDLCILGLGLTSVLFGVYISGYLIHIRILSKYSPNNSGFF